VYWVVTRLALGAVLLVTCLHFVLNSGPFPETLSSMLKSVLPGTLEFGSLQISPVPWKLNVLDVQIKTPGGENVVTAGTVRVTLDPVPLIRYLLGESGNLLEIRFRSVHLEDFSNTIAFDEDNNLEFLDAFVWPPDPNKPGGGEGPEVHLTFNHIIGERGSFRIEFPQWDLSINGIVLDTSLFVNASDGEVRIRTPELTFLSGEGHIRAAEGVEHIPRTVQIGQGRVRNFAYDTDRFTIEHAKIELAGVGIEASGRLSFASAEPLAYGGWANLSFQDGCPTVHTATNGLVNGPFSVRVTAEGDYVDPRFDLDLSSPGLFVGGLDLGSVKMLARGGRDESGAYAFRFPSIVSLPGNGNVKLNSGLFHPFGRDVDPTPTAEARLRAKGVDLASVLRSLRVPRMPRMVPIPHRLGGRARVSLRLKSPETPHTIIDVSASLKGSLDPASVMDGRSASATLRADVSFKDARPTIKVRKLSISAGRDYVKGRGSLDLSKMTFAAHGEAAKEIGSLMSAVGSSGRGVVRLTDLDAGGSLGLPRVSATFDGSDLRIDGWSVAKTHGEVVLHDNRITVNRAEVKTPYGTVSLGTATLGPLLGAASSRRLVLHDLSGNRFNLTRLPPLAGLGLRGSGDLEIGHLELALTRPSKTLSGSGRVSFPLLGALDQRFSKARASFSASNGRIDFNDVALRLGIGEIRAFGTLDIAGSRFELTARGDSLPLSALAGLGKSGALQGTVDVEALAGGALSDPKIKGRCDVKGLQYDDFELDNFKISVNRNPGSDLMVSSDRFISKIRLDPRSGLTWNKDRFSGLFLALDLDRLTPQDIHSTLRKRDFWAQFTGRIEMFMGFGVKGRLKATVESPPDGLVLGFMDKTMTVTNRDNLELVIHDSGDVTVSGLALDDGSGILEVCGEVIDRDGETQLLARGPVGLYWFRFLKDVFSTARGYVLVSGSPGETGPGLPMGCPHYMRQGRGSAELSGSLWPVFQPSFVGKVTTGPIHMTFRRYPDAIKVMRGGHILFRRDDKGTVRARIPREHRLQGKLGEGDFLIHGEMSVNGLVPDSGVLNLSGTDIRYSSAGNYMVAGNPDIEARFENLTTSGLEDMELTGSILITGGSYHRDFDVLHKAFSGVMGERVAEREGPPLESVVPWLAGSRLDLTITGSQFGVRTRLPFGSSDLEMAIDLALKGTVAEPEVWNRMEVLPGGKFVYKVVRREFEVLRGAFDFDGDPAFPMVDVTARTWVEYRGTSTTEPSMSSRFTQDMTMTGFDQGIEVTLNVSGRYPDLDISLSSNTRDLDQTDLMYLVLTGQTSLEAGSEESSSVIDLGLLTDDMTNLLTNLLLSPFVDAIRFGVTSAGGVNAEVMAHMGSRLKFQTNILKEEGASRYSAGFQIKLTNRLLMEGRMRAVEQSIDPSEVGRKYEMKLRYRIPVD